MFQVSSALDIVPSSREPHTSSSLNSVLCSVGSKPHLHLIHTSQRSSATCAERATKSWRLPHFGQASIADGVRCLNVRLPTFRSRGGMKASDSGLAERGTVDAHLIFLPARLRPQLIEEDACPVLLHQPDAERP